MFDHWLQAMYIRVKRIKTTYFVQCDPTETILEIKQKLHNLIDQPVNDQRLILVETGEVLNDSKTLADQKVVKGATYWFFNLAVIEMLQRAKIGNEFVFRIFLFHGICLIFCFLQVENDAVVALTLRKGAPSLCVCVLAS